MSESPSDQAVKPRTRSEAFAAIRKDRKISDAGHRLWHSLYSHFNPSRGDAMVWPGYRTITKDLGYRPDKISRLILELEAAGWIRVIRNYDRTATKGGRREHNQYELLDGQGEALRKNVAPPTTEKRSANMRYGKAECGTTEKRSGALRKSVAELTVPTGQSKNEYKDLAQSAEHSHLSASSAEPKWKNNF
jgi:DNA-binding MarR family transcriptional regulator